MADLLHGRMILGRALQQTRHEAGMSGLELADILGWPPSKVAMIEDALLTPTSRDIDDWLQATRSQHHHYIHDLLASLESAYHDWRRDAAGGVHSAQSRWLETERNVSRLQVFEPHFIPGLLQTYEYAHGRISAYANMFGASKSTRDIELAVETRLKRQEILDDETRTLKFLITEMALTSNAYENDSANARQAQKILEQLDRENVEIRILGRRTAWGANIDHGFWIFDSSFVSVEIWTAELRMGEGSEIDMYERVYDHLWGRAEAGEGAIAILSAIANRD